MNNYHICALFISLAVLATVQAYPQFQAWDRDLTATFVRGRPIIGNSVSTTPATPTTPSQRYLSCVQLCPSTSEYNPICGTDDVNYYNIGRFNCARQCGQNVQQRHLGICSTTTLSPLR